MLAVLAFVYGTAAALFVPALIGPDPADGGRAPPAGGQRAARLDAQRRQRRRAGAGRRRARRSRARARRSRSTRSRSSPAPRAWSRLRPVEQRRRRATQSGEPFLAELRARLARGALAPVADLGPGRDERLPRLRPALGLRARAGPRRARARRILELGDDRRVLRDRLDRRQRRRAAPARAAPDPPRRRGAGRRLHAGRDHRQRAGHRRHRRARARGRRRRRALLHALGPLDPGADPRPRRLARERLRLRGLHGPDAARHGGGRPDLRRVRAPRDAARDERGRAARGGAVAGPARDAAPAPPGDGAAGGRARARARRATGGRAAVGRLPDADASGPRA